MTASQELLDHVNDPNIPDKNRILRTRALVGDLTRRIDDRAIGQRLHRSLNDAYLNLQLATIADDPGMIRRCRQDCILLIGEIGRAAGSARADAMHAPAAQELRQ